MVPLACEIGLPGGDGIGQVLFHLLHGVQDSLVTGFFGLKLLRVDLLHLLRGGASGNAPDKVTAAGKKGCKRKREYEAFFHFMKNKMFYVAPSRNPSPRGRDFYLILLILQKYAFFQNEAK